MPIDFESQFQAAEGTDKFAQQDSKKVKNKKYKGIMEWILDREGHEFLVQIDRNFLRDEENLHDLIDKLSEELQISKSTLKKGRFSLYLRHLYKAAAPTAENLQDDKYL